MNLTETEIRELERWMDMLAPGYRIFDLEEMMRTGLERAEKALKKHPAVRLNSAVNFARLVRHVITDPERQGYGVPYVWWWILFESEMMRGITQDPWSEVKWWAWNNLRGRAKNLTMWGCQSCLAPETPVRMFDGSAKRADQVRLGDVLMGDDSKPRNVTSTCAGFAPMVRVTSKIGKAFVCTENHLVTVVCKRGFRNHGGRGGWSSTATPGRVYDITAHDLMKMGESRQACYGLLTAPTQYPEQILEFSPYIYGLWLGDGTKTKPEITGMAGPVLDEWESYFRGLGYRVNRVPHKARPTTYRSNVWHPASRSSNPFLNFIRTSSNGSKFILPQYLRGSIGQRLELLAGLIDTDGHLAKGLYYELVCSDPALMDGYEQLANSLGFRTNRKTKITNYRGKSGDLHITERLAITGDIARIPVRMPHKRKARPKQGRGVKKHGVSGFTVERIGVGEYAGFEVDGNHRFLLADYTITHNSGKSSWGSRFGACQMAAWLGDAMIYVGGPYKEHTDDKAWAELAGWISHLRNTGAKNDFIASLNIGFKNVGEEALVFDREQRDNAGTAKFVALESASAIQGKKTERHDEEGLIGISMLMIDEFIENPGLKLKRGEGNYSSNSNYFGLFPCNPDPEKVQHPAVLPFSDPIDVNRENLRKETHFRWKTAYGELIRFCWQNSPNRILGRTVWPYLLNQRRHDNAKDKGSDIIAAQIEAWGFGIGANNAPLDAAAIKNAGTYNSPEELGGWQSDRQRIMHVDAAFGGSDPASYTILESGIATMIFGQAPVTRQCFSGVEQGKFQVDADFRWTKAWHDEMEELMRWSGGSFPPMAKIQGFTEGQLMGGGWHLAGQVLRKAYDLDIQPTHVCFDSSQRGDCTDVMLSALGRHNVQWYYEGTRRLVEEEALNRGGWYRWPYVYELNEQTGESAPLIWSKVCTQVISMIWLFSCEVIRHGFLINGEKVKKGLDELCARQIVRGRGGQTEGRKDVMGKDKLKDMGLPSPTWGEGLATAIYFGTRFKQMIKLDTPKLTMSAAPPIVIESIIRAPGSNRRFNARQWH